MYVCTVVDVFVVDRKCVVQWQRPLCGFTRWGTSTVANAWSTGPALCSRPSQTWRWEEGKNFTANLTPCCSLLGLHSHPHYHSSQLTITPHMSLSLLAHHYHISPSPITPNLLWQVDKVDIQGRTLLKVPGYEQRIEFGVLVSFAYPIEGTSESSLSVCARTCLYMHTLICACISVTCQHPE